MTDEPIELDDDDDDEVDQEKVETGETIAGTASMWTKRIAEVQESECDFTSIAELRAQAVKRGNTGTCGFPLPPEALSLLR